MKKYICNVTCFIGSLILILILIGIVLPFDKDGYTRAQKFKMDKLSERTRKPSIVILGGSNVAFGYDTKELNDSLPMTVFNAGLHASLGMKFFLDDCSQYLKKGDILVFSPEYDQFYGDLSDGQAIMADAFYLYGCHYPGKISYKQIIGIIQNTPSFLKEKIEYNIFALAHKKTDPVYKLSSFNKYGDVTWHWYNNRSHNGPDGKGIDDSNPVFNERAFEYIISKLNELKSRGVTIVMYPPVFENEAYAGSFKSINYIAERLNKVDFPYACSPDDCSFPKEYFYDTNYHMNHKGALLHNKHLIKILKAYQMQE